MSPRGPARPDALRRARTGYGAVLLLLVLAALGSVSCAEEVATAPAAEEPFTLYGVLSPALGEQSVMIFPVERTLGLRDPSPLDAAVTTTDLSTGETMTWRDSVVANEQGQYEHIFWAPFQVGYGRTYRMEARRSDGNTSFVEAKVPPETELRALDAVFSGAFVTVPVRVIGAAPRLLKLRVIYHVEFKPTTPARNTAEIVLNYDGRQRAIPEGWEIPVYLTEDYHTVVRAVEREVQVGLDRSYGLRLLAISVAMIVAAEDWNPPASGFDLEVIAQPGTMENVQNGFGLVTAGYRNRLSFRPSDEATLAAGFEVPM